MSVHLLWTRAAGEAPGTCSYTALLARQDGVVRIGTEDEDVEAAGCFGG
jgi:hypothetical protein